MIVQEKRKQLACITTGSSQTLMINHSIKVKIIEVYNITGKLIAKQTFDSPAVQLPISSNKKGIYLVRVIDSKNKIVTRKIPVF